MWLFDNYLLTYGFDMIHQTCDQQHEYDLFIFILFDEEQLKVVPTNKIHVDMNSIYIWNCMSHDQCDLPKGHIPQKF